MTLIDQVCQPQRALSVPLSEERGAGLALSVLPALKIWVFIEMGERGRGEVGEEGVSFGRRANNMEIFFFKSTQGMNDNGREALMVAVGWRFSWLN